MIPRKLSLYALLFVLLAAGCGEAPPVPSAGQVVPSPSVGQVLPSPSVPEAYPPPPTARPDPTVRPLPTMTPPPPVANTPRPTPTPQPTRVVTPMPPFPTPAVPPIPPGEPPAELQAIWYLYFPAPDERAVLQAVLVDGQGQRWGELKPEEDLGPGGESLWPKLFRFHISPDYSYLVADAGYGEESKSYWMDPTSWQFKPITTDLIHEDFLAWGPNHQVLAGNRMYTENDIWVVDLHTEEHRTFVSPGTGFSYRLVATSPDGSWVADVNVKDPTSSGSGNDIEIGLQPLAREDRVSMATFHIPQRVEILENNLAWSPDGQYLSLLFLTDETPRQIGGDDGQLWLVDVETGEAEMVANKLMVYQPPLWSPDGRYIAFVKAEHPFQSGIPADLWLLDMATSTEIPLTHYSDRRVTSVAWSPEGSALVFSVKLGDYAEVWITSLDGTEQYPIAGPTPGHAPVGWLLMGQAGP
jgi:WD40 repeat protein